jgi:FtsZ-interacting cell division protein ZipA
MTTGQIVAIVVLVLLIALVVAAVLVLRKRNPSVRRAEAAQHRREAEQRRASAERLEAEAAERAERARAEHAQAQKLAEMAAHDRQVAEKEAAEAVRLDPEYRPEDDRPAVAAGPTAVAAGRDDRELESAHRDRPRRSVEYDPEPIVGGAAEGMITPRRRHAAAQDGPAHEARAHDGAAETVPTPVEREAPPAPSSAPEQHNRTLGDAVRDRDARTDPAGHPVADGSSTATGERPTLADRIMGRA